jgi:UDP-N-acetylenolpyruvoylglucosamine reductase
MKKIRNADLSKLSYFWLNSPLRDIFVINNVKDYKSYLAVSTRSFKLVWWLSNLVIWWDNPNKLDILVAEKKIIDDSDIEYNDDHILVNSLISLNQLCTELLKRSYDCSYLLGIPWTVSWAIVNNAWSGKEKKSIIDNLIELEYFYKNKTYIKKKKDIVFSYRNTELKCKNNIFVYKVKLQFDKISRDELDKKIAKRMEYRKRYAQIYAQKSLWSLYVDGKDALDVADPHFILNNNKIIHHSGNASYEQYEEFKDKLDKNRELEVEEIIDSYKEDYVGIIVHDADHNFLLQLRDDSWCQNPSQISFFWGRIEEWEWIFEGLSRELLEELSTNFDQEIQYYSMFMKWNKRCFIYRTCVEDLHEFSKKCECKEWDIRIVSQHDLDKENLSNLSKKVLNTFIRN